MSSPAPVREVDPAEGRRLAADGALLLDVREPAEWAAGHAAEATLVPLGSLGPDSVAPGMRVVTVCRSGARSMKAAQALAGAGYDVVNLAGGMTAWQAAGLPVVTDDGHPGTVV